MKREQAECVPRDDATLHYMWQHSTQFIWLIFRVFSNVPYVAANGGMTVCMNKHRTVCACRWSYRDPVLFCRIWVKPVTI